MKAGQDSNSAATTDRVTAHHSVWTGALSVLVTGAAIFGAGAATAFPVAKGTDDVRLAS